MPTPTYLQHDLVTSIRHELGYEPKSAAGFGGKLEFTVSILRAPKNKGPVAFQDEVEILRHASSKAGVECSTWPNTIDDRYNAILYQDQVATFNELAKAGLAAYRASSTKLGRRYYAVVKAKETIDSLAKPKK
ncbi:hypothetical protein HYX07_04945 [Candidatus Woesearchaeota archaeon]|nr:hypothetical protein [Candidatus Woesearchaeota archaeon]